MNKAKKLIIGGVLAAGIAGGGLVAGCSNGAKPHGSVPGAAEDHSVTQNPQTGPSAAPGGSGDDCSAVHSKIKNGGSVDHQAVFSCENDESNKLAGSGNSQGETETCRLVNGQTDAWRTKNLTKDIQDLCKGEGQSAQGQSSGSN